MLQEELDEVWSRDFLPPSSPDLNPLDFSIWAHLEKETCPTTHPNLSSLKEEFTRSWEVSKEYVVMTCQVFKIRIMKVIEANSDYML